MKLNWTETQLRRLKALDVPEDEKPVSFASVPERESAFQQLEKRAVSRQRERLERLRCIHLRPGLCRLQSKLVQALNQAGFVQVATPIIMSKGHLSRMSITETHPLFSQVFWVEPKKCLRPMLAPHLYFVLKDLLRLWPKPVRIFEIGPCFRKESQGAQHSSEFTMLNLVEMGLPEAERENRISDLAALVTGAAGIDEFALEKEASAVYGDTIDVISGDVVSGKTPAGKEPLELGSSAMGPHPLDRAWKVTDAWVGIGFGVERLLMAAERGDSLARFGRSLTYLDGVRLNI